MESTTIPEIFKPESRAECIQAIQKMQNDMQNKLGEGNGGCGIYLGADVVLSGRATALQIKKEGYKITYSYKVEGKNTIFFR